MTEESVITYNPDDMRQKIERMEEEMRQHEQIECPLRHYFGDGVYAREIIIPAGTLLTGKIHKYEQINILSKGDISVMTEDGVKRVQAPFTVVSPAGTKRIAYAHEECVWTTILRTDLTDPELIEDHFTASSEKEYQAFLESQIPLQLEYSP